MNAHVTSFHAPAAALKMPPIKVSDFERDHLAGLCTSARWVNPGVADVLEREIDRAEVFSDEKLPSYVVRMGSTVMFRIDDEFPIEARLVYPGDTDTRSHQVSVLTSVGAALIGMMVGATISFIDDKGVLRSLIVFKVTPPYRPYLPQ